MQLSKFSTLAVAVALLPTAMGAVVDKFTGNVAMSDFKLGAPAADKYTMYKGDGSAGSGWPEISKWVSFDAMWDGAEPMMKTSCGTTYTGALPDNTDAEIQTLKKAIIDESNAANVDPRFILAIVMQESNGCLRVHTTLSPDPTAPVRNPGIMQDHDGANSCNANKDTDAAIKLLQSKPGAKDLLLTPCPDDIISGMVKDGVHGTVKGDGLVGVLNKAVSPSPGLAARQNSGQYVSGGVLVQWNATNLTDTSVAEPAATATTFQTIVVTASSGPSSAAAPLGSSAPAVDGLSSAAQSAATSVQAMPPSSASAPSQASYPSAPSSAVSSPSSVSSAPPVAPSSNPAPAPSSAPSSAPPAASQSGSAPAQPSASSATATSLTDGFVTAQSYYRAARLYNSGTLVPDALGQGGATACYAADVANRLTGWTGKDADKSCTRCDLDWQTAKGKPGAVRPWNLCKDMS